MPPGDTTNVPIGWFRFDGEDDGDLVVPSTPGPGIPATWITPNPHRNAALGVPTSGGLGSTVGAWHYGAGIDGQAHIDAQIVQAAKSGTFWIFDWYGTRTVIDPPDQISVLDLEKGFLLYKSSALSAQVPFALNIISSWFALPKAGVFWGYENAMADYVAQQMTDPRYQRAAGGRPILYVFSADDISSDGTKFSAHWANVKARIIAITGVAPWVIICDGNAAAFTAMGADAIVHYGPAGGAASGVAGRYSRATQQAVDQSRYNANLTRFRAAPLNFNDQRPLKGELNAAYAELPTRPQFRAEVRAWILRQPQVISIAAWNERHEEGPVGDANAQEAGTTMGNRFNEDIALVRGLIAKPATETYKISSKQTSIVTSGTWTLTASSGAQYPAYDSQVAQASTLGAAKTYTDRMVRCRIFGTKRTDGGVFLLKVDGVTVATVDTGLASGSPQYGVALADTGILSDASHAISVELTGSHVIGTSNLVEIDSFEITDTLYDLP